MSTLHAEVSAYREAATAVVAPLREMLGRVHNGFMSNEDAAWSRSALAEVGRLRAEGERLAEALREPTFTEWVEILRAAEIALRKTEASARPVYAS